MYARIYTHSHTYIYIHALAIVFERKLIINCIASKPMRCLNDKPFHTSNKVWNQLYISFIFHYKNKGNRKPQIVLVYCYLDRWGNYVQLRDYLQQLFFDLDRYLSWIKGSYPGKGSGSTADNLRTCSLSTTRSVLSKEHEESWSHTESAPISVRYR